MFWNNWIAIWNGDFSSTSEWVAEDFKVHATMMDGSDSAAIRGPEGLTNWITGMRQGFADLTFETLVGPISEGDNVAGHWRATASYQGGIPGATAAIGTRISFTGTDVLRLENGKAAEYWLVSDTLALLGQLGMNG